MAIEKSRRDKEYILEAFLDIERAFNNVKTDLIRRVLEELGETLIIITCVIKMLQSRVISSASCHDQKQNNQRNATRGCFNPTIVAYRD